MARQKCTFKWQDKSVRFNGKTKCTFGKWFKWQDKSLRLNGKTKVYVMARLNCSVRLNCKEKVYV